MPKRGILIVGLIALIVIITFLALRLVPRSPARPAGGFSEGGCPDFTKKRVQINNKEITVAVADSPDERMHGLSGCPEIPAESGMYFVIKPATRTTFWMKDMLVPLDIIWIKEEKVTGVAANVPPPLAGQPDAVLPQYKSPSTVDAVLELPAGTTATLGITTGTTVKPIKL